MTAAAIWTTLALLAAIAFLGMVVWWDRADGPSTDVDVNPSQPPAGPGAEGMRVPGPGDVTTGSPTEEAESSDRQ